MSVRRTRLFALGLGLAALVALLNGSWRCLSLPYPPHSDQDNYLAAGRSAAEGTLSERAPLYSLWMAAFYEVGNRDLRRTFQVEKLGGTLLLAVATALLSWHLEGGAAGILAGAWVMNCKYLLQETNGSHTVAAALWAGGLLALSSSIRARRVLGLTLLFLTTQVRLDMRAPFALAVAFLAARDWADVARQAEPGGGRRVALSWSSTALVCGLLWAGLHFRTDRDIPDRLSVAFRQSFALTYAERHHILHQFPNPWNRWPAIWDEALPGAPDVASALRKYPYALLGHVAYQARLSLRVVPAMVLAFEIPLLMLLLVPSYLGCSSGRGREASAPSSRRSGDAAVAAAALLVLVPVSCIIRVAARNYIQLIPLELLAIVLILRWGLRNVRRGGVESA
jgi:hypothetical protein